MIKYNNSTINDWNFDDSNIKKVYYGITNTSRLPSGYTEVEYVENTGNSTVNLGIQLMKNANDTFEVVFDNEMTYDNNGGQHQTFLTCCAEIAPYYNGWYCRFDGYSSTVVIGGNVGTLATGRTLVSGSTYHTTINGTTENNRAQDFPLNLFSSLDSTKTPWRFCKGKLYNMTVTYNNELVRNLVPCKNSLNVAGLYDLVNDVFYSSESGYDELVSLNQANIQEEIDAMKVEVKEDLEKDIHDMFKKAFKGKGIAADEKKARQWLRKAVNNPKGGKDILADIRKEAAEGDEDAKTILKMVK